MSATLTGTAEEYAVKASGKSASFKVDGKTLNIKTSDIAFVEAASSGRAGRWQYEVREFNGYDMRWVKGFAEDEAVATPRPSEDDAPSGWDTEPVTVQTGTNTASTATAPAVTLADLDKAIETLLKVRETVEQ